MKTTLRAGFIVVIILALAEVTLAVSLDEYRQRVKTALSTLEAIRAVADSEFAQNDLLIEANLRVVRERLPRNVVVDWNGTKYLVDNGWLDEQLKDFEKSAAKAERLAALDHAHERLQALDERLNNVETIQLDSIGKSELRDRIASILQRSEYKPIGKEESALERLLRALERLINRLLPKRNPISPGSATAISRVSQILVIVIALAVIGYALWMFAPRFLKRSYAKKNAKDKARVVLGERLEPDKSAADLLAEAEALARSGDLRGAIRRGYIALLVELADRKIISLAQHKTNRDYLRSVRGIANLHRSMESLTNNFELHWYGLVPADEQDWNSFRAGYKEALTAN
ncbi:MAG TPA: DUF4129 domain-containing protein [Pyrinomonadaceae bacterium]|nr:DUF4129 domain-containing protein [Pyrinomonadaceae bacterium]